MNKKVLVGIVKIIWLLVVLIVSCNNAEHRKKSTKIVNTSIDIPINYEHLSYYNDSEVFNDGESIFFVGYNHTMHSYDVFSLTDQKVHKSVNLQNDGPNTVLSVGRFAATSDYIVSIHGNQIIFVIDYEGTLLHKIFVIELEGMEGLSLGPFELDYGNFSKLSINDNVITVPAYTHVKRTDETYFDNFYFFSLDIENPKKYNITKTDYPLQFKTNFYGDFDRPYIINKGDSIIYNFPSLASINLLLAGDATPHVIPLSGNSFQETSTISKAAYENSLGGERFNYFFNSSRFFALEHDPWRALYYIVRKGETDEDSRHDDYHLLIMDEQFEVLDQVALDNKLAPVYFATEEGLLFPYNQPSIKNESTLSFELMDIKIEDF